jgi:hypothetical protein
MAINETGMDEEEVDRQIARDNARADELGLVLDSDPRRTDMRGAEKVEAVDPEEAGAASPVGGKRPAKPPANKRGKESRKELIQ